MAGADLGRRVAVAAVGIPIGVGVIYLGAWPVAGVAAVFAAIGAGEVYRIARAGGGRPFSLVGVPASALLVLAAAWAGGIAGWSLLAWTVLLALTLGTLAGSVFLRGPEEGPLAAVTVTVFGALYAGATLSFAVHLRTFPGVSDGSVGWTGAWLVMLPLVATWMGDTFAYFTGHRWGRRKLRPGVSPGKTVEGGIGGLVGAAGGAALFAALFLAPDPVVGSAGTASVGVILPVLPAALLGLLIGGVAQVADLAESLLKREAGVKDSGVILPGHGGVLDRFDAVFFTLPFTYAMLFLLLQWP